MEVVWEGGDFSSNVGEGGKLDEGEEGEEEEEAVGGGSCIIAVSGGLRFAWRWIC